MILKSSETYIKKHDEVNEKSAYTLQGLILIDNDVHITVHIVMQEVCFNSETYDTRTTRSSLI